MRKFIKNWWIGLLYGPNDPRHFTGKKIKIAVIGGGTGLANLLRGLKKYSDHISAIVAVTDNGRSSGVLRNEFDILPPGDIRKCISALAYDEKIVADLFEYRFDRKNNSFSGHTLGNIWITALAQKFNSFAKAVEATTEIFKTAGRVLPATLNKTNLCAIYDDKKTVIGESKIPRPGHKIKKVYLQKKSTTAYCKATTAIKEADIIIFGPGSLYTSVIPNLLIKGISGAIRSNIDALGVYICNCSTERGETENYSVRDHIKAIFDHCGGAAFDYCLVNNNVVKKSSSASKIGSINNITTKEKEIENCKIISADLVSRKNPLYHDSKKLAKAVFELYNNFKRL